MSAIGDYIASTRAELVKVSWPTKKQVAGYTGTIIVVSLAVAFILGGFDFVFSRGLAVLIDSGVSIETEPILPVDENATSTEDGTTTDDSAAGGTQIEGSGDFNDTPGVIDLDDLPGLR